MQARQFRRVDLSADSVETRAFVFKIISHVAVFLSSRGYDLAACGEFMRKSGVGVIPEPREVNYSTSGREQAAGNSPTKEIRTIVADENHSGRGSSSTMGRETPEDPAATKNSTTFLAVRAELTPRDSLLLTGT